MGSVTVDVDLLDAADLLPGEPVHIGDITSGARLETYVTEGERAAPERPGSTAPPRTSSTRGTL